MSSIAWIVLVLFALWLLVHRAAIRAVRRDIEAARRDMYRVQYESQEAMQDVERELRAIRLEDRARRGLLKVGPSTTVEEALALHPNVEGVLAHYHIAGAGAAQETLGAAADTYAQDLEAILVAVTKMLEDPDGYAPGPQPPQAPPPDPFSV